MKLLYSGIPCIIQLKSGNRKITKGDTITVTAKEARELLPQPTYTEVKPSEPIAPAVKADDPQTEEV